jgi:uncharacterized membrane protein (Fun14 family)
LHSNRLYTVSFFLIVLLFIFAYLIPEGIPFIVGLLIGLVLKKTVKIAVIVIAFLIVLIIVGYFQVPSFGDMMNYASEYLPVLWAEAAPIINLLPYSSALFMIGVALGLWKG